MWLGVGVRINTQVDGILPKKINNLVAWYDASKINQVNNTVVTALQDLSGNSVNLTSTAGPTYISNVLNGNAILRFSGTNWLKTNVVFNASSERTVLIVARLSEHNNLRRMLLETSPSWFGAYIALETDNKFRIAINTTTPQSATFVTQDLSSVDAVPLNTTMLLGMRFKTNDKFEQIIGNAISNQVAISINNQTNQTGFTIGTAATTTLNFFTGDIAEIMIYNRQITNEELSLIYAYVGSKWGVV